MIYTAAHALDTARRRAAAASEFVYVVAIPDNRIDYTGYRPVVTCLPRGHVVMTWDALTGKNISIDRILAVRPDGTTEHVR